MNISRHLGTILTFAAAAIAGCAAAVAIASSQGASSHRETPEVIRLDPVVVTLSKSTFDAIRSEAAVAGTDAGKTAPRG